MMSLRCVLALLLTCLGRQVIQAAPKLSIPKTEIIEIVTEFDDYNSTTEKLVFPNKGPNSIVVVGEHIAIDSRILLKCTASYPVQWIYLGDGVPIFTIYTNLFWQASEDNAVKYSAEASIGLIGFERKIREVDTGNYTCRSLQDQNLLSYYYIYVPGQALFTSPGGKNITYTFKDSSVRIPCSVSDPSTNVMLCKFSKGRLQCPTSDATYKPYDPTKGFDLNLWDQPNPSGTYVCAASNKNLYKVAEYTLVPAAPSSVSDPCNPSPCGYQAECIPIENSRFTCYCERVNGYGNPYQACKSGPGDNIKCYGDQDCQESKSCIVGKCVDPCNPSPCGKGSQCEVVRKKARCSCKKGYEGKVPYCKKVCEDDYDCDRNEMCKKSWCEDACPGSCGINADCKLVYQRGRGSDRTASCSCPAGFTGNPKTFCRPAGGSSGSTVSTPPLICDDDSECLPGELCISNICSSEEDDGNHSAEVNPINPCRPNPCPDTYECKASNGKASCKCPKGYKLSYPLNRCRPAIGDSVSNPPFPPSELESCEFNEDCPRALNCVQGLCKPKSPSKPDKDCLCGFNAECANSKYTKDLICKCLPGYTGDPETLCSRIDNSENGRPAPPVKNPCKPNPCADYEVCKAVNGRATCKELDEDGCEFDFDCLPIEKCVREKCVVNPGNNNNNSEDDYDSGSLPPADPCDPSPCTKMAQCRAINGLATCKCPRGFRGDGYNECTRGSSAFVPFFPPASPTPPDYFVPSRAQTTSNPLRNNRDECELEDESFPTYSVSSECGPNAKCEIVNRVRSCVCKNGFYGKPPNCQRFATTTSQCITHDDCYPGEVCTNNFCINPCNRDSKYPCAPLNSECRVVDRIHVCSCARGYSGDPRIRCRPSRTKPSPPRSSQPNPYPSTYQSTYPSTRYPSFASTFAASNTADRNLSFTKSKPSRDITPCERKSHCNKRQACIKNLCVDPCLQTVCSSSATCRVLNHVPICIPNS